MNYCVYCRNQFEFDVKADPAKESATCLKCEKITVWPPEEDETKTLELCSSCFRGVTLEGCFCLWCGTEIRAALTALNKGWLERLPFHSHWQISRWEGKRVGSEAPLCPQCGHRIRQGNSPRPYCYGSNPPWNAGWDGSCEHCLHRFDLRLETLRSEFGYRSVQLRPQNLYYAIFYCQGVHLSGLEITVTSNQWEEPQERQTIFLAMGESAQLMRALEGAQSVWLQQYDWEKDLSDLHN